MQMARALSSASPSAMSITKDALNGSLDSDLDSLLKLEAASQAVAGTSDYHKEATRRFVEKQAPQFQWPATAAAKP
jgi:2-(1,2-epoxy-1,2-dihydrophenyl)acetyl-CoA isomerase